MPTKPNFFIIGVQKCGTTAMFSYLEAHPQVFVPAIKEPHYFSRDTDSAWLSFRGNEADYLALFDGAEGKKAIGEASPSYSRSKLAPERIFKFNPQARLILMLRNPVDLVYSMYHHTRYMGDEPAQTFRAAITPELEKGIEYHSNRNYSYLDFATVAPIIRLYLDYFPQEQFKIIFLEDFQTKLAQVYRETLEFLDVDPTFVPQFTVVNASKEARNKTLQAFLERSRLTPSHVRQAGWFRAIAQRVPASAYERFVRTATRLYTREAKYPPMDADLRLALRAYFADEIQDLETLTGRDLGHW